MRSLFTSACSAARVELARMRDMEPPVSVEEAKARKAIVEGMLSRFPELKEMEVV